MAVSQPWSLHAIGFSQPSPGLHYCWGLFGFGPTLCWLRQLWCLWLPLRVCQNLHEDHDLCWHNCCCKCFYEIALHVCVTFKWNIVTVMTHSASSSPYTFAKDFFIRWFPLANRLLQPADWSVNDSVGHVHGDVGHWEFKGSAALPLLPQANWWWDELRLPHGSSHGFGPALLRRGQVRCQYMHALHQSLSTAPLVYISRCLIGVIGR